MFSRCYCVKLNPLRYQQVFLFFPLLYFISRISMIRQASNEQLDSLPILQQSVITEHSKLSSQTRSTKTIMIIISSMGWKKFLQSTPIFIPFIIQFYFGFFGEAGRTLIFRVFPPSFRGYGGKTRYLVRQFLGIFSEQQKIKSDISRSHYTLWNTILKKKSLAIYSALSLQFSK